MIQFDLFAHAKVCKLGVTLHGEHHVFWFDVAMEVTLKIDQSNLKSRYPLMKELKSKNKLCCMECSSLLIKSAALERYSSYFFPAVCHVKQGDTLVPQQCGGRGLHQRQTP